MTSYLSPQYIRDQLDGILYKYTIEDKFSPGIGTLDSLNSIILDVAPQIRNILRSECKEKKSMAELDKMWSNKRVTRKEIRDIQKGKKRYFNNKIEPEAVLKTWLMIPRMESNGHREHLVDEK